MNEYINFSIARKELNKNQSQIAEEIGVTRATIGNTERGVYLSSQYLDYLTDKGYSKDWLLGKSNVKKTNSQLVNSEGDLLIEQLKSENTDLKKENSDLKLENKSLKSRLKEIEAKLERIQDALTNKFLGIELGKLKASSPIKANVQEENPLVSALLAYGNNTTSANSTK